MNGIDLRQLSDRELFRYLLLGDLARPGWSSRRRQMVYRALEIAAITLATVIVLIHLAIGFVLLWAASLPAPR